MTNKPRPIIHFELPSRDAERSAAFYSELFGWSHGELDSPYLTFSTGNLSGAYPKIGGGLRSVTDHLRAGDTIIYVASENLELDLCRAVELGGRVLLKYVRVSDTHEVALIEDPNGARVMLTAELRED